MRGNSCILVLAAACASHGASPHPTQSGTCPSNAGVSAGCGVTPHDDCLGDPDCGPDAVCTCQTPIRAGEDCPGGVPLVAGNVCVAADCRLDSDCALGACQTEVACGVITGLFCRTSNDECVPTGLSDSFDGNGCLFRSGRWRHVGITCPG